mgnify:CR=1 FL=1
MILRIDIFSGGFNATVLLSDILNINCSLKSNHPELCANRLAANSAIPSDNQIGPCAGASVSTAGPFILELITWPPVYTWKYSWLVTLRLSHLHTWISLSLGVWLVYEQFQIPFEINIILLAAATTIDYNVM